jgi:hypothetical protein
LGRYLTGPLILLPLVAVADVQADDFTYLTNNGTITIARYVGTNSVVNIPGTVTALPITSIASEAFTRPPSPHSIAVKL